MKKLIIVTLYLALPLFSFGQTPNDKLPKFINILNNKDTVGLYEKLEVRLMLQVEYENPFDPEDIDIKAVFTSPSGKKWPVFGFYNQSGFNPWLLRFTADEPGTWKYTVKIKARNGEATSEEKSFVAVSSKFKGPIQIAPNRRYLQHKNGAPFYGVGLWYNGNIQDKNLDELKDLGVNFISKFIVPLETHASGLGRYDQLLCKEIDDLIDKCEERNMVLSLNLWFHSFLSETVWGGFNVRWYTNPYQKVTAAKDFYRSDEAWRYQEKLYRYFIARWSYSRALAIWFIIDEVNGTDGWVSGDSLQAATWLKKVHDYFKTNDPYNHPTTGTRSGGKREFWHQGYGITDLAGREIYEAQGFPITKPGTLDSADVHPLTHSYRNYAGEVSKIWNDYGRPVIIGETGWDHTYYEPSMPGYLALYHNACWVSLATGTAMTPFWWAYSGLTNDNVVTRQMTSIKNFTSQIPFEKLTNITPANVAIKGGDGYGMKSDQLIFGWMVNAETDVAGKEVIVSGTTSGKYKLKLWHTWRGRMLSESEVISDGSVKFSLPSLHTTGSHANYIGQDIAFILEPIAEPPPVQTKSKKKK